MHAPEDSTPGSLARLVAVARGLSGIVDPEKLLNAIIDGVIQVAGADRGAVVLGTEAEGFKIRAVRTSRGVELDPSRISLSNSVVADVVRTGRAVVLDDASGAEGYRERQSIIALNLRTIICAPLTAKAGPIGVLYVDGNLVTKRFTTEDLELTEAFAAIAAMALESVRMHQVDLERARISHELELAAEIQRSFLPSRYMKVSGYAGAALTRPAGRIGGDLYDWLELGDGRLVVTIGDVSGKGVPAALGMARVVSSMRSRAARAAGPADLLEPLNRAIVTTTEPAGFLTVAMAVVEPGSPMVEVFACGHPPPLHRRGEQLSDVPVQPSPPLGVVDRVEPVSATVEMLPGDRLVFYTDGALDACDAGGEEFGYERLCAAVASAPEHYADAVQAIADQVEAFARAGRRRDDLTLVCLDRRPE